MIEKVSPGDFFGAEAHDMRGGLLAVDDVVSRRMLAKCPRVYCERGAGVAIEIADRKSVV